MKVDLVIFGAGGLAREVLNAVMDVNEVASGDSGYRFRGFVSDPEPDHAPLDRLGARYLGKPDDPSLMSSLAGVSFVVGIGDLTVRRRVQDEATRWGLAATTIVHPQAVLGRDVDLGPGVVIQAGSLITSNIRIGAGTLVNLGCTIGHDSTIGAFCNLSPNVSVSGRCVVGDDVDLGTGAVVLPDRRIGDKARVGAGAVVSRDVEAATTVVGVPARPLPGHK